MSTSGYTDISKEDFLKAQNALEKAHVPGPYYILDGKLRNLEQAMEEMANVPKEELGKRQPGERQASETIY